METGDDRHGWLGLNGRVVAVTGAAGGIGAAMARAFAAAGAKVGLLDVAPGLDAVAEELGPSAVALHCDVSDAAAVSEAADQLKLTIGPANVLVNTAAMLRPGDLLDLPMAEWNRMVGINLGGYFACAQAFGRQMAAIGGGAMVHVASTAGTLAQAHSSAYSVTKAGILMLSRVLAAELGPRGVRSNVVSPAMVRTPMSESFYQDAELLSRRENAVPLRRIGVPEDIAQAALFLASDRASYITGAELVADGGILQALSLLVPRPGYGA